jgi:TP901 family phage tail tape measure protein
MDVATLRILIDADASGAGKGFAAALASSGSWASGTQAHVGQVKGAFSGLESAWGSLSGGEKALVGFGVAAGLIGTVLHSVIAPAIEFESAFAGVKKTVDATPAGFEQIRKGLLDMSTVMPVAAKDLAQIAENAGQLGVKAPDILNFTKVIAELGATTNLSFDQASTQLAQFLSITGSGAAKITPVADALVALGNAGASTESDIVNFSLRLASAFTVAGATQDQILGVASAFASMGIQAEAGGSALSSIITNIADAARGGNTNLNLFAQTAGILPEQFKQIALTNPVEALLLFGEGLRKVIDAGGSVTPILEELGLSGLRTSEVMRLLALNSAAVREQLRISAEQFATGGAAQEEYDKRMATTASHLQVLGQRLDVLKIQLGTPLLGLIVAGADEGTAALGKFVDALTPLGQALAQTLSNGAELASAFWSAIGSSAAQLAIGVLSGATISLTQLLDVINSLGPAGLAVGALAAYFLLFGPGVGAAVIAIDAFSAAVFTSGVASASAAAGVQVFQAAMSVGPLVLLAAELAAIGSAFHDAGTKAEAAGLAMSTSIADAAKSGNFDALAQQLANVRDRQQELEQIGHGDNSWPDRLGKGVQGAAQILTPFTENTVVNAQKELEKLDQLALDNGWSHFESDIRGTASVLGLTEEATLSLANQMGLLQALTAGTADEHIKAQEAMKQFALVNGVLAERLGVSADALASNTLNAGQMATALGITGAQMKFVADSIGKTTFDDLFSDDAAKRAAAMDAIITKVSDEMAVLAKQIGLTTGAYIDQIKAMSDLASAQDTLTKAISGARTALDAITAQQEAVTKATEAYTEAVKKVGNIESFTVAVKAARELSLEYAGLADSPTAAIAKQEELRQQLIKVGEAAGIPKAKILELIATLGLVPPAVLTEIQADGKKAKEEADAVKKALEDVANGKYQAALDLSSDAAVKAAVIKAALEEIAKGNYSAALGITGVPEVTAAILAVTGDAALFAGTPYTGTVGVTGDREASAAILAVTGDAALFASTPYTATASVDGTDVVSAQFAGAQAVGTDFALAPYGATTTLDGSDLVVAQFAGAHAEGTLFATAGYVASTSLDGTDQIVSQFSGAHAEGNSFANQPYDANATLAGTDQVVSQFAGARAEGTAFATSYAASASVSGIEEVQSAFAGARASGQAFATGYHATATLSTTTTNTTINQTINRPVSGAFAGGGISFAEGGMSAGVREVPGWANIYAPVTPYRIFAEPTTGGEAYIPLAESKRPRSIQIWQETGRHLGVFADGAVSEGLAFRGPNVSSRQFTISAPINLQVTAGPGMDTVAVAELAGRAVRKALAAVAADFQNIR